MTWTNSHTVNTRGGNNFSLFDPLRGPFRNTLSSSLSTSFMEENGGSAPQGCTPFRPRKGGIGSVYYTAAAPSLRLSFRQASTNSSFPSFYPRGYSAEPVTESTDDGGVGCSVGEKYPKEGDGAKEIESTTSLHSRPSHSEIPKTGHCPSGSGFGRLSTSFSASPSSVSPASSSPSSSSSSVYCTSVYFSRIHPLHIDTCASAMVQSWLEEHPYPIVAESYPEKTKKGQGKGSHGSHKVDGMECFDVKGTTWKRAVLPLFIPEKKLKINAVGQSKKKKQAQMLCFMHAAQLIEHYRTLSASSSSVPDTGNSLFTVPPLPLLVDETQIHVSSTESAYEHCQELIQGSPLESPDACHSPVPLQPRTRKEKERSTPLLSTTFPTFSTSRNAPADVPFRSYPSSDVRGNRLCLSSASIVPSLSSSENKRMLYLSKLEIPPSPNPLVNKATEQIRREGKGVNPHALHALNERIPGASSVLQAVQLLPKVHVVQYPIDKENHLIAIGVASKAKVAKVRCAAHAIHILDLYKQKNDSSEKSAQKQLCEGKMSNAERQEEAYSASFPTTPVGNPTDVVPLSPLMQTLPFHNQLLLRFMGYCFGVKLKRSFSLLPHANSPQDENSSSSLLVTCDVQLGDVTCTGKGVNTFEAERNAVANAVLELQFCDDRVAALQTFISCHPHLTPERLPRAQLPHSVQEHIHALVVEEQKVFGTPDSSFSSSFQEGIISETPHGTAGEEENGIDALSNTSERGSNKVLAQRMQQSLSALRTHPVYIRDFHPRRITLPIATVKELVLSTVKNHQVTVIAGTTGCGKTTQVPQYLLDNAIEEGVGDRCNILVTQSRRLSTFNVANRIASERLEVVGKDVGYAVRLETVAGKHINICTSGVLLQMLTKNPLLSHVSHLILDEVHDRDINCDLILALVKTIIAVNKNIRVILMSATIEATLFSSYFGGAPVIHIDGATFPVSVLHLEEVQAVLQQNNPIRDSCSGQYGSYPHHQGNRSLSNMFTQSTEGMKFGEIMEEEALLRLLTAKRTLDPATRTGNPAETEKERETLHTQKKFIPPPIPPRKIDYDLIADLVYYCEKTHLKPLALKHSASYVSEKGTPIRASAVPGVHVGSMTESRRNVYSSILVFLPGWKELMAAKQAIERFHSQKNRASSFRSSSSREEYQSPLCHIILLHSSVDSEQQRSCFLPPPPGYFKVILATNIAESGITIDDVAVVIDTGLIKETDWRDHSAESAILAKHWKRGRQMSDSFSDDEDIGREDISGGGRYFSAADVAAPTPVMATQLTLKYASRANCIQRTGRAGRTQGGVCYRLFSKQIERRMKDFPEAEIHRVPLSQVILKCLSFGHSLSFLQGLIEPPLQRHVLASMHQLVSLGAVTKQETLTPLGLYLSRLPCDPRMGKLIIMGAVLRCLDSALTIAASTDASPFLANRELAAEIKNKRHLLSRQTQSDPITSLNAYNALCANQGNESFAHHNLLDVRQLRIISQYKQQYKEILVRSGFLTFQEEQQLQRSFSESGLLENKSVIEGGFISRSNSSSPCRTSLREDDGFSPKDAPAVNTPTSSVAQSGERTSTTQEIDGVGLEPLPDGVYVGGTYFVDTSRYAMHSLDIALVKACVASCLFPNIAVVNMDHWVKQKEKGKGKIVLRTRTITNVKPASGSVCRYVGENPSFALKKVTPADYLSTISSDPSSHSSLPAYFYVFQDIFRVAHSPTVQVQFLREVSSVSLWALLLFCGSTESFMTYHEAIGIGVIDNWIGVYLDRSTYQTLCSLRQVLDRCLLRKFRAPTDHQNNSFLQSVQGLCYEILHLSSDQKQTNELRSTSTEPSSHPSSSSNDVKNGEPKDADARKGSDCDVPSSFSDSSLTLLVDSGSIVPPMRDIFWK